MQHLGMGRATRNSDTNTLSPFYAVALSSAGLALAAWFAGHVLAWLWPQLRLWPLYAAMIGWLATAPDLASQPSAGLQRSPRPPLDSRRVLDTCAALAGLAVFILETILSGYWRGLTTLTAGVLIPAAACKALALIARKRPTATVGGSQMRILAAALICLPAAVLLRAQGADWSLPPRFLLIDQLFGALLSTVIVAPLFAEMARPVVAQVLGRNPLRVAIPAHLDPASLEHRERHSFAALLRPLVIPSFLVVTVTVVTDIARQNGHPDVARLIAMIYPLLGMLISRQAPNALGAGLLALNALAMTIHFSWPSGLMRSGSSAELREMVTLLLLSGMFGLQSILHAVSHDSRETARTLVRQALRSDLSGLPNQRALARIVTTMLTKPERKTFWLVGVLLPDIARWSDLTDNVAAAELERSVAGRLHAQFENLDTRIAHPSSGRFVLIVGDRTDGIGIRQRLHYALSGQHFSTGQQSIQLRFHAGIVEVPNTAEVNANAVLTALSMALQRASATPTGIHRVTASKDLVRRYRTELQTVEIVSRALNEGRIRLFVERIDPTQKQHGMLHFEVLARVLDDTGRILEPREFLPAIWHAGLSNKLDRLVFVRTIAMLASHPKLHNATNLCSINVCGPTLCDPEFPDFVRRSLKTHAVDPGRLMIEITESSDIADLELARDNVMRLSEQGLLIALDDFGTGLATFDYLKKLHADVLKIDGSFIRRLCESSIDREIVSSIVRIAHATGARTVAEWIETPEQRELATKLGVDYLQGRLISSPIPIESLELPTTTGVIDLTLAGELLEARPNLAIAQRPTSPHQALHKKVL